MKDIRRTALAAAVAATAVAVVSGPVTAAPAATRLVATVGPGYTITLTKAGKKVKLLKAGKYSITVRDRSGIHDFHVVGPVHKVLSSVSGTGTKTVAVTLKRGKYVFYCAPHKSAMKGSFKVT